MNSPAMQETQETRVLSLGQENPLEEGMTTHSSILAWRIPWTEEPGGLQYIGSDMTEVTSHTCNACSIKVPTRWHLALLGKVENSSEVAQSCPILWDPMDRSLPGSSVQGIFEARILEWVAIAFSRGSYQPRNGSPTLQADSLPSEPPGKSFLRFSFFN